MSTTVTSDGLFRMPTLGADMTEGRVAEWLVTPGSEVERGDLVAVIETDKSDIEIEVFEPCVVEEFLVELGQLVPVGTPIARIRPVSAAAPDHPSTIPPSARRVTPRARRLARERAIDLDSLPLGATITGDDVLRLSAGPTDRRERDTAPAARTADPHRGAESMRLAIASLMERSWTSIPHYHLTGPIDVTGAEERLAATNLSRPPAERLLLGALLNVAIARAAAEVPDCNGWWRSGTFVAAGSVDLGMVVSLRKGGIVVPTIAGADRLSPDDVMARMRDLVERSRRGRLRGSDLGEASITVTSLGDVGAESVAGVIHPPQVALIGLGSVRDEAVVHDGEICARRIVHATVAGDHRAHDGRRGAHLLERVRHHLEDLP